MINDYLPEKSVPSAKPKINLANRARKKRKILARILSLKANNPTSPNIPILESNLKDIETQRKDQITKSMMHKEVKAINSIKTNPSYFYGYAKKFSRSRSRVGPLKHACGSLTSDPLAMSNLLQNQFASVFSDPSSTSKKAPKFNNSDSCL